MFFFVVFGAMFNSQIFFISLQPVLHQLLRKRQQQPQVQSQSQPLVQLVHHYPQHQNQPLLAQLAQPQPVRLKLTQRLSN